MYLEHPVASASDTKFVFVYFIALRPCAATVLEESVELIASTNDLRVL